MSSATCDFLRALGGFHVIERGIIDIKGKGSMCTFWLVGSLKFPPRRESVFELTNEKQKTVQIQTEDFL